MEPEERLRGAEIHSFFIPKISADFLARLIVLLHFWLVFELDRAFPPASPCRHGVRITAA